MDAPEKDAPEKPVEIKDIGKDKKEDSAAADAQVTPSVAAAPAKRKPSIWIRLLRGLLGILILFSLGALTVVILLYIPARRDLDEAKRKAEALATQASTDLQSANQEIERLSTMESDNQDLQSRLDAANLSVALLQIRLDVANAQAALADENPDKAKLALSKTDQTIQELAKLLPQAQQPAIASLQSRLKLVLDGLEEDIFAARSDLDVMANTLLELENALNR